MYKTTAQIDGMACSMCEAHVNDTVRRAFRVKKVTSSHKKGECVILAEEPLGQAELAAALDPTGYRVLSAESEPYRFCRKGGYQGGRISDLRSRQKWVPPGAWRFCDTL